MDQVQGMELNLVQKPAGPGPGCPGGAHNGDSGEVTFPQGTVIYPDEYKVILLDKSETAGTNSARLHASASLSFSVS